MGEREKKKRKKEKTANKIRSTDVDNLLFVNIRGERPKLRVYIRRVPVETVYQLCHHFSALYFLVSNPHTPRIAGREVVIAGCNAAIYRRVTGRLCDKVSGSGCASDGITAIKLYIYLMRYKIYNNIKLYYYRRARRDEKQIL